MGIVGADLRRIPADNVPVFVFQMDCRVDFFGVMPNAIAAHAEPALPGTTEMGALIVEGRETLAWFDVELYGFTVKEFAVALDKHLETMSRLVSRAAMRRVGDRAFQERIQRVDSVIAGADGDGR